MRILVVEDHAELAELVAVGLRRAGLAADVATDGEQALERFAVNDYDVVVLDRDLPLVHGDEVCRRLVAAGGRARVLMLTAASALDDKIEGLGLGADDYLPKPVAFGELVARCLALARRAQPALPPVLEHGNLSLDSSHREVRRGGRRLELSPKEFAVLELLLQARGAVVSAEQLLERAWDEATDPFTATVKVTISRLRRKLGDPTIIETVPHAGYRIARD
jgi:DNA-binding response OmpR family regulator